MVVYEMLGEFSDDERENYKLRNQKKEVINDIVESRFEDIDKLAYKISRAEYREFLADCSMVFFDEILLYIRVLGYSNLFLYERMEAIEKVLPVIDNWFLCDLLCEELSVTKWYRGKMWEFIRPYFRARRPFQVRFAIVMCAKYYKVRDYLPDIFMCFEMVCDDNYFVENAMARTLMEFYIKFPKETKKFILQGYISESVRNMTLKKIAESDKIRKKSGDWAREAIKNKE